MTIEASAEKVSLSSKTGENLPFSSYTRVHFLKTTDFTRPSSATISFGPQPGVMMTPSSRASLISFFEAGIMSSLSRETMVTLSAPLRFATLAASMATLPPPMTMHEPVSLTLPVLAFLRNSTAVDVPSAFSFSRPGYFPPWHPMAM